MKIKIICVGKIKEKFFTDAIDEYKKRLSKFADVTICEVNDEKTKEDLSDRELELILSKEGERMEKYISPSDYVISLAIEGKKLSSEGLSEKITGIMQTNSSIAFIIGGSLGIDSKIKKKSDFLLSFSDMTFPHQLMRVCLLEQIYRSFKIANNEPYHK